MVLRSHCRFCVGGSILKVLWGPLDGRDHTWPFTHKAGTLPCWMSFLAPMLNTFLFIIIVGMSLAGLTGLGSKLGPPTYRACAHHLSHLPDRKWLTIFWSGSLLVALILPPNRCNENQTKPNQNPTAPLPPNITEPCILELHIQESPVKCKWFQTERNRAEASPSGTLIVPFWLRWSHSFYLPLCTFSWN